MLGVNLRIAARNLIQQRKRTLFLTTAIAAVTALLILLQGLTTGIRLTMLRSGTTLMTGHVNVGGFFKPSASQAAPLVTEYNRILATLEGKVPELDYQVVRGRGWVKGVSEQGGAMDLILGGLDIDREQGFQEVVHPLRGNLADLSQERTILLFEGQLKRLKVEVGEQLTLSAPTPRGTNNTVDVRVAAIARDVGLMSSMFAFVPEAVLRELYQLKPDSTGAIQLYLRDASQAGVVAEQLRGILADAGWLVMEPDPQPYWMKLLTKVNKEDWTGQKLDVTTYQDEMQFMDWILSALGALSTLLIGILAVIVVIGIMNTMWIAIRERTREIGTLRAIGMQRGRVLLLFLLEALLLGLVGTGGGALGGWLVAVGINALGIRVPEAVQLFLMNDRLTLIVLPGSVLAAVVAITCITTAAAIYPAIRAARLKPVDAMHHFG